jgi:hypothetical protein
MVCQFHQMKLQFKTPLLRNVPTNYLVNCSYQRELLENLTCMCSCQDDHLTLQTLPSSYQYRKLVEPLTRLRSCYSDQDAHLTPQTFTC